MPAMRQATFYAKGFTLLELMVVLVLMGLLASVVLPRMSKVYDRTQAAFELEDIRLSLARIPLQAFTANVRYELTSLPSDTNQSLKVSLPDGWTVKAASPIVYQSNGICLGGNLVAAYGDVKYEFVLLPPNCVPKH
jgi:general secretion pathway protein G